MTQIEDRVRSGLRAEAEALASEEAALVRDGRTAKSTTSDRPRFTLSGAGVAVAMAVVVLVTFGGVALLTGGGGGVANDPLPNSPSVPVASDPDSPFQDTWVSLDGDGSTPTMMIEVSEDGAVEITVHDDPAGVCSGAPSTMIGTGQIEEGSAFVFVVASPVLACDDGSQPEALSGPPLEEQLRNLTFVLDMQADTLTDNFGSVWTREGAEAPGPETLATGMWPQSNLEEVQEAQELADAGDPDYTWQVDAGLASEGLVDERMQEGQVELLDRFLREVLGWEAYQWNPWESPVRFLRCAPGLTNPLYPPSPDPLRGSCAPTLDDLRYESVSLDLVQPDRQGPDGIWVVNRWEMTAPFAQTDPAVPEVQATERLEAFLAARIAGQGAEGSVGVNCWFIPTCGEFPLLYATTAGAPYERFEFERVSGPEWPFAHMTFSVRLFADDGATVVEQKVEWGNPGGDPRAGLTMDYGATTENGQLVPVPYYFFDGEVVASAPGEWWESYWTDENARFIDFTDPVVPDPYGSQACEPSTAPADAAAVAQEVIADPNFESTTPVATRIGGLDALSIDVALAPGVGFEATCWSETVPIGVWIYALAPGLRQRLYLVDLPEGVSMRTLAITVTAPESRFEELIEEAQPIIESIEFHPD